MKRMVKKTAALFMIFMLASLLFAPMNVQAGVDVEGLTSEATLMRSIKRMYPDMVVRSSFYDDFDGDGLKELFVISGSYSEVDAAHGIYFASGFMTARLADNIGYLIYDEGARVSDIGDGTKLFYTEVSFGGSGSWTYCYYVRDGVARQVEQELSQLRELAGTEFLICGEAFDIYKDREGSSTGHSYKMYFVKWNGKKFEEFNSKYISKAEFKKYNGAAAVLSKISRKKYKTGKIIYRENGVININVQRKKKGSVTCHNLTLFVDGDSVKLQKIYSGGKTFWDKYSFGGTYKLYVLRNRKKITYTF